MKIAYVLDDTLDTNDGVQQYVRLLGGWMSLQGHEVHYITGQSKRTDIKNLHSLSKNIKVSFNKNRMSIPLPVRADPIKQLLNKHKYDVLHVQMPYNPLLAAKLIKYRPMLTACVATFHIAPHSRFVTKANKLLGLLEQRSISSINKVVSVSTVAQQFALEAYNIKTAVIPNAIDTTLWQPKTHIESQRNTIVFVGRLVKRKGAVHLLRAFKQLLNHGNFDYTLIVAGDGPERTKLEDFVEQNNLSSHVKFLGYVSEDKKKQLLQNARIAVYPATGGESFGIVLLEAMAAGTVVLAGNNPGYASVLVDCPQALFDPFDERNLANTINTTLTNQSHYESLRHEQQQIIKNFDIAIVGNAILNIYNQAIKQTKEALYAKSR